MTRKKTTSSPTYYRATHPETGKWMVGETTSSMGQEIWRLIRGDDESEFLTLLRDNPGDIKWETITKREYTQAAKETDPPEKKKRGRVPVSLVSEFEIRSFKSIAEVVKHLEGKVPKSKIMKMVNDPSLSVEGYSIVRAEG